MKKVLTSLICLLAAFTFVVKAEDVELTTEAKTNEKITVYLFSKDGCPHCVEAQTFFSELEQDEEYGKLFKLVDLQVYDSNWNEDATNKKVMDTVAKTMEDDVQGVPYIVIGNKYSTNGYASSLDEEIKQAIKDAYEDDEYKDIVADLIKDKEDEKSYDSLIIIGILALVIGGCGSLIYFSRKK